MIITTTKTDIDQFNEFMKTTDISYCEICGQTLDLKFLGRQDHLGLFFQNCGCGEEIVKITAYSNNNEYKNDMVEVFACKLVKKLFKDRKIIRKHYKDFLEKNQVKLFETIRLFIKQLRMCEDDQGRSEALKKVSNEICLTCGYLMERRICYNCMD